MGRTKAKRKEDPTEFEVMLTSANGGDYWQLLEKVEAKNNLRYLENKEKERQENYHLAQATVNRLY